jgi:hypothetical protein
LRLLCNIDRGILYLLYYSYLSQNKNNLKRTELNIITVSQEVAFYIREKISPDMIKMASVRKRSNGKTYYMVENSNTAKAVREFRKLELNQNNKMKKDDIKNG